MSQTLTIEVTNDADLQLLLALTARLAIKTTLTPSPSREVAPPMTQEEWERRVHAIAGSWSAEDADAIERAIEEAKEEQRQMDHSHRDVEL